MVRQRPPSGERPKRESLVSRLLVAAATLACCNAHDCEAIERIVLEVGQLSTAGVQASDASMTLDVPSPSAHDPNSSTVRTRIAQLHLTAPGALRQALSGSYNDIDIVCPGLIFRRSEYGCDEGSLSARGGPLGQIAMNAAGTYDSSSGALSFRVANLNVAGGSTRFNGTFRSGTWSLDAAADDVDLATARKLAQPWFQLPAQDLLGGHVQLTMQATGQLDPASPPGEIQSHLTASSADLNYSNQPGTMVGQNVALTVTGTATRDHNQWLTDVQLRSASGQVLAGAVLLDLARNPLQLQARLEPAAQGLGITQLRIKQTDLLDAQGNAQIGINPLVLERAHLDIYRLEFAAAYRSFLQLTLATTDFGALNVGGRAGGSLDMTHGELSQVSAYLQNVSMADGTARLSLANVNGEVHWVSDATAAVKPSRLSWSSSSAYGLIGGPVQMGFSTHGADFLLDSNTRFPIFDGALVIHTLAMRRLGDPDTQVDFDAHLEPISMPLLSKAFGWPVLSGHLAGTIPGVTYRDHVLAVQGDLAANVFDGTIVGSHLKLSDPWGPWPRLDANVAARHLDLDLVTHTFSIGSISGRLDADIKGLELFNWAPVAFDARLQTTPGDRSRHLISQRAVTSISNVGGGGGGVAAALQSGVLKFFDKFHYDRLGISCQLRDEVCLMNGVEPARSGYYLVKGRGLPRIDIIGNAGRVDWTQLVGQISASMHSQNIVVR